MSPCRACQRRHARDRQRFRGQRERTLRRDDYQCRACGSRERLVVHHRRPGTHTLDSLIVMCRSCHQRIHHMRRLTFAWASERAKRELWQEQHRGSPEQLLLLPASRPDPEPTKLFEFATGTATP